jgi:hypothetical protein
MIAYSGKKLKRFPLYGIERELQNSIRAQIRAFFADTDFSQIAYDQ